MHLNNTSSFNSNKMDINFIMDYDYNCMENAHKMALFKTIEIYNHKKTMLQSDALNRRAEYKDTFPLLSIMNQKTAKGITFKYNKDLLQSLR